MNTMINDAAVEAVCLVINVGYAERNKAYRDECKKEARAALEAALPHLAVVKQDLTVAPEAGKPVSVGRAVARDIIAEFVQCADAGRPPGKLLAQARDFLAARKPVTYHGDVDLKWLSGSIGEVAHRLSTYMPTGLAEWSDRARDCKIASRVLGELAARQPVGEAVAYQYRFWIGESLYDNGRWSLWQPICKEDYERELAEPSELREVRALYAAPPVQPPAQVDLEKFRELAQGWINHAARGVPMDAADGDGTALSVYDDCGTELLTLIESQGVQA